MKVLVACEYSGRVRDAFIRLGHEALSCDLLPSESDLGPHFQGDIMEIIEEEDWDLMVAHPPCTYLSNSGVRWLYRDGYDLDRWEKMFEAAEFFDALLNADIPRIAVENPVMHGWAGIRRPDFSVQPWQFGDPYKKRTCFWTKNLPPLVPTCVLDKREAMAAVHRAPPSPDRWKDRSRTYPGIAAAIAQQWGA